MRGKEKREEDEEKKEKEEIGLFPFRKQRSWPAEYSKFASEESVYGVSSQLIHLSKAALSRCNPDE